MFIPKDFIATNLKLLKYSGLRPPSGKKARFWYFCIIIPPFLLLGVLENIAATIQIFVTKDQFRTTMLNIGMWVPTVCSTMRLIYYYIHITDYAKVIEMLQRKSFNFENFFDLKSQTGQRYVLQSIFR